MSARAVSRSCIRPQSADNVDEAAIGGLAPWASAVELSREPHVGVLVHKAESRRHDADDLILPIVELDEASLDIPIAAEAVLPQTMADDGHERRIRPVVVLGNRTTEHRCDAKQRERTRARRPAAQTCDASPAPVKMSDRVRHVANPFERLAVALPIEPVRRRHAVFACRLPLVHHHQAVALWIRQRP